MRLEAQKYLFDVRQACERIREFTFEQTFADYSQSPMLRSRGNSRSSAKP